MTFVRDAFAAETEDDFDLPAVVRRKAPARPRKRQAPPPRKIGMAERLLSSALSHPGRVLAALFLAGCSGAIAWNALVLQNVRHPAPLFKQSDVDDADLSAQAVPPARPGVEQAETQAYMPHEPEPAAPVEEIHQAPVSVPKPPARNGITDLIRSGGVPAQTSQPATRQQQQAAAPAPSASAPMNIVPAKAQTVRDPIAEMIRMGGPVPMPPANVGRPEGGDIVLNGQRALARLGYGVTVDGVMGPGTRQAIERFEKDRRLPVTGGFGGRTARELSAQSGIAVQ